jgi:hypothetical protein
MYLRQITGLVMWSPSTPSTAGGTNAGSRVSQTQKICVEALLGVVTPTPQREPGLPKPNDPTNLEAQLQAELQGQGQLEGQGQGQAQGQSDYQGQGQSQCSFDANGNLNGNANGNLNDNINHDANTHITDVEVKVNLDLPAYGNLGESHSGGLVNLDNLDLQD